MHELDERVAALESQMAQQVRASAELTKAVTDLTNTLTSGKLAVKLLFGLAAIGASSITFIHWLLSNFTIKSM